MKTKPKKKHKPQKIELKVTTKMNVTEIVDLLVEKVRARKLLLYLAIGLQRIFYHLDVPDPKEAMQVYKVLGYVAKHWKEILPRAEKYYDETMNKIRKEN